MKKDKNLKSGPKKGLPGSFLLFLFAMVIVILTIQSLTTGKKAKVSFSHQVEHLVNLDLIHLEQSRKIAQKDNLVTFTGRFKEMETKDAQNRIKYLTLLNKNFELKNEKGVLAKELDILQKDVKNTSIWFLGITGLEIPKKGFAAIGSLYDTPNRTSSVVVKSIDKKSFVNLKDIQEKVTRIEKNGEESSLKDLKTEILTLIELFKSKNLGIGSENFKNRLKSLNNKMAIEGTFLEKMTAYKGVLSEIDLIVANLVEKKNDARLIPTRAVRNYLEELDQYNVISEALSKNELLLNKVRKGVLGVIWFFNNKELSTRSLERENFETFNLWFSNAEKEWGNFVLNKGLVFKVPDQERNAVLEKTFKSKEPTPNYFSYLFTIIPVVLVILVLYFIFSRQMKGGVGSSAMTFGKSRAKMLTKEKNKTTFKDVAGAEEAKEELEEIVEFLRDPQKFTILGARIPKGVLLVGPPGTGKTLIAKAVAGEADRPFFSISGSDFVEMFVGVGASRVRDLFDQGKKNAPCIIFMDEIDAVGRQRGAGIGGGHDEREQTLNQLLVEMDGFDTKEGVILMAATNRPDILDKALLRPGRFDRRVVLDLPDIKGRYEILKVHARKIKIDPSVDLMNVARVTPGASGADLENILNEAALLAARKCRNAVTAVETAEAADKVRFGKERRSLEMDEKEKKSTAFHESGHAIVGLNVEHADPVDKVTIIPRGFSLGATHFMPKKNRLGYWKKEVIDQLAILLGGRAAEEIFLNDMSSGAQQDINQATKLARAMVCEWGMSEELGAISYEEGETKYLGVTGFHEKIYSDETARKIDREVYSLIESAHKRAREIAEKNRDKLVLMADMLIEFETLDAKDIKEIMDGSWNAENKRKRLKEAEKLQLRTPPPPPKNKKIKDSDNPLPSTS
jgi:cell division protease FtsH